MNTEIPVTRSSMPPFEEYVEEIRSLWESRWLTNFGTKHQKFEEELKKYLGTDNISLCVNGHQSLECLFEAMGLSGEVITTPFTFASTTHSLLRKGIKPVFCDVCAEDFTLDPDKIEELITEKTSAILAVHVYGNLCDVEAIDIIAKKHNLKVIYDAAHAFGVKKNGIGVANFGDASIFSFHATKVFHSIEGGAITYADSELRSKIVMWENFGMNGSENPEVVGGNAKMNEFAASMGLCNLRHIEGSIQRRRVIALRYRENLSAVPGIFLNPMQHGVDSNYAYFPILIDPDIYGGNRDIILDELAKNGIKARRYFYPATNMMSSVRNKVSTRPTPVAEKLSRRVLTLPLYEDLGIGDVDRICNIILACRS